MWTHCYLEPGERYGRWTVVRYVGLRRVSTTNRNTLRYYLCRCDCGTEREVCGSSLTRGVSQSCGCLRVEAVERARKERKERKAGFGGVVRHPAPYVPEHPEEFTDDWMFLPEKIAGKKGI